jgi:hypothetical protein
MQEVKTSFITIICRAQNIAAAAKPGWGRESAFSRIHFRFSAPNPALLKPVKPPLSPRKITIFKTLGKMSTPVKGAKAIPRPKKVNGGQRPGVGKSRRSDVKVFSSGAEYR